MTALALVMFVLGATLAGELAGPRMEGSAAVSLYVACVLGATGCVLRLGGGR